MCCFSLFLIPNHNNKFLIQIDLGDDNGGVVLLEEKPKTRCSSSIMLVGMMDRAMMVKNKQKNK